MESIFQTQIDKIGHEVKVTNASGILYWDKEKRPGRDDPAFD
jgi:hypothetical protein